MSHRALPRWIPACAGMTSEVRGEGAFVPPRPAPLDSRLRGNDELKCWERWLLSHRALARWIPACAGMTSEVRGEGISLGGLR